MMLPSIKTYPIAVSAGERSTVARISRWYTSALQALHGQTVVVKFGGSALSSDNLREALIDETVTLIRNGLKVVVVHGGGSSISEALNKQGIPTKAINGLRVTDLATMEVVVDVLSKINKDLASDFEAKGVKASAITGVNKNILISKRLGLKDNEGQSIDIGWVGDIQLVDRDAISAFLETDHVPVIAPIGRDNEGNFYNLNADHAALSVAAALQADNLIFLTDVPGVLKNVNDVNSRISQLSVKQIQEYIDQGIISKGMLPKVQSCISGIKQGIQQIAIVRGGTENAVLKGILAPQEIGTLIKGAI